MGGLRMLGFATATRDIPRWALVEAPDWHNTQSPVLEPELDEKLEGGGAGWAVTVFNNDVNTYQEVIAILVLATQCTVEEAYIEAWEIDHFGQSMVHRAGEAECRHAAAVISTIGIRVEVTPEWE